MSFDALTIGAILVIAAFIGVLVRVCTLVDNSCNGSNEYLDMRKDESSDKQERPA
jgi:hypothetical protein